MQLRKDFEKLVSANFPDSTAEWDNATDMVMAVGRVEEATRPAIRKVLTKLTDMDDIIYENG